MLKARLNAKLTKLNARVSKPEQLAGNLPSPHRIGALFSYRRQPKFLFELCAISLSLSSSCARSRATMPRFLEARARTAIYRVTLLYLGNTMTTSAPGKVHSSTSMWPPWTCTIRLATAMPSPIAFVLVV